MARALAAADESASPSLVVGVRREAGPLDTITIAPSKVAGSTAKSDEKGGEEAGEGGSEPVHWLVSLGSMAGVGGNGKDLESLWKDLKFALP
jgi:hypothetical protein